MTNAYALPPSGEYAPSHPTESEAGSNLSVIVRQQLIRPTLYHPGELSEVFPMVAVPPELSEGRTEIATCVMDTPFAAVCWYPPAKELRRPPGLYDPVRISRLIFQKGVVEVHSPEQPAARPLKSAILASLSLSNKLIANVLFISENTVNSHLKAAYRQFGIHDRAEIAPAFYALGIYSTQKCCEPPVHSTPRVQQVVEKIAEGKTNQAVADELDLDVETVRSHLKKAVRKSGLDREALTLATLLSRHGTE